MSYEDMCDELMNNLTKKEKEQMFSYKYCEYEYHFLGFLENYADLKDLIPKNFTIIDVGCYLAIQSEYFKEHNKYIGIQPGFVWDGCDISNHFHGTSNSIFIEDTAKGFVENFDRYSKLYNLDKDKIFVICSAVPAFSETALIEQTFPYVRIAYPGEKTIERLPEKIIENDIEIEL